VYYEPDPIGLVKCRIIRLDWVTATCKHYRGTPSSHRPYVWLTLSPAEAPTSLLRLVAATVDAGSAAQALMARTVERTLQGIAGALRARLGVFAVAATAVFALDMFLPPVVLSLVRKPADYFTFNPWLTELPGYLAASNVMLQRKLAFLPNLALFWFSADSPFGGVEWGFAVTVADLARYVVVSLLFGLYFALVFYCRDRGPVAGWSPKLIRGGGASGIAASVLGVSTGGCTVVGCGAPVLPIVGLAFVGLSSGAVALLAEVSRVATAFVFTVVTLGILYLGWRAGERMIGGPPPVDPLVA